MKIKYLHFSILIFVLFGIIFTNNTFACSMSPEYYDLMPSDFFKEAEVVFIGKVIDHDNYANKKISESTKVSFEILKQYKGKKVEKIDLHMDDYSTCGHDMFLMEAENNQIFAIMASKSNWKMIDKNKNKFTIVGDGGNNKIFELESKAEEFIKEACDNCKEINKKKSEPEAIKSKNGFFKRFLNWFLSLF